MQSVAPVLVGEGHSCYRGFSDSPGIPQVSQIALKLASADRQGRLSDPRHDGNQAK
jgi:hypothetical protein